MRIRRTLRRSRFVRARSRRSSGPSTPDIAFIGAVDIFITTQPQVISIPAGSAVGDLAVIGAAHNFSFNAASMSGGVVSTRTWTNMFTRILTAADITAGTLSFNHQVGADPRGPAVCATFRGVASATPHARTNSEQTGAHAMPTPGTARSLAIVVAGAGVAAAPSYSAGVMLTARSVQRASPNASGVGVFYAINTTGASLGNQTLNGGNRMVLAAEFTSL